MSPPRLSRVLIAVTVVTVTAVSSATPALASTHPVVTAAAATSLNQVMTNLRNLLVGLLAGGATLFFTLGGVRYLASNGDPGEVEKAKRALRNAAIGYGLAILAPVGLAMLKQIVGQ